MYDYLWCGIWPDFELFDLTNEKDTWWSVVYIDISLVQFDTQIQLQWLDLYIYTVVSNTRVQTSSCTFISRQLYINDHGVRNLGTEKTSRGKQAMYWRVTCRAVHCMKQLAGFILLEMRLHDNATTAGRSYHIIYINICSRNVDRKEKAHPWQRRSS